MINLASRKIKGQYKRTLFGQLWSLANPIALMIVYTFVFAFVFRVTPGPGSPSGLEVYPLWLLAGLLPWTFIARGVSIGTASLTTNEGLIQKVFFSRLVLPISEVLAVAYNWAFEMFVLLVVLFIVGAAVITTFPYLILAMFLLILFTLGMAMLLSIANVYFRDTEHFVSLALQLMMYVSPVVYPISLVQTQSEKIGNLFGTNVSILDIYLLNPVAGFMTIFRDVLYNVKVPPFEVWVQTSLWSVGLLLAGYFVFSRHDKNLAEAL